MISSSVGENVRFVLFTLAVFATPEFSIFDSLLLYDLLFIDSVLFVAKPLFALFDSD